MRDEFVMTKDAILIKPNPQGHGKIPNMEISFSFTTLTSINYILLNVNRNVDLRRKEQEKTGER